MELSQAVIDLHNIARAVEQQFGQGNLSDDIRQCANRVNHLLQPYIKENNNVKETV